MAEKEREYSHRTLMQKLGVKAEHRVYGRNLESAFERALRDELDAPIAKTLRGAFDLIFFKIDSARDLGAIATLGKHLTPSGGLWIIHPKGKEASPTEHEIRAAGLGAGLVDNKVSSYSQTHTSTRYVIPRSKR